MKTLCRLTNAAVICIFALYIFPVVNAGESVDGKTRLAIKPIAITEIYEAMGTIRPLSESNIHSQITAKIIDVLVTAGTKVEQGELLIRLDDREEKSRLEQAKEGISIAEKSVEQALKMDEELTAEFTQVDSDYARSSKLYEKGIKSKKEFDQAKTAYLKVKAQLGQAKQRVSSANASLRQAKEVVEEARLFVDYANIRALNSGIITKRDADPGDLATPAKSLLTIQTGSTLRLEAGVRESLIDRVKVGMQLKVRVGSKDTLLTGIVEEIEPYADAKTRSFMVKVGIPVTPGVYPGMFGRILITLGTVDVILLPVEAVTTIGQLNYVNLIDKNNNVIKVFIKTGEVNNNKIEVLSGLAEGDIIIY